MAFLRWIVTELPVSCPPGVDFKASVSLPFPHPVLNLLPPHLHTCSPPCEKVHLWPSAPDGFRVWPQLWNAECLHWVCWEPSQESSVLVCAPVPILCGCSGFTPIQAGAHSPRWEKPWSGLKKEQELYALFLATRAELWSAVSQHFLLVISSQAWVTPGSLAATWATCKLLLLHCHGSPSPLHMKFPHLLCDRHKIKWKKST